MAGYFLLNRGLLEHPALAGDAARQGAFVWLIEHASFAARPFNIQGKTIQLARGQVAASLRYLAAKWGMSEPGVRRFITRLKTDALVDARTDAGVTVITICGYEEMQAGSPAADAPSDAPADAEATQDRRSSDAIQNQGNQGKQGNQGRKNTDSRRKRRSRVIDPSTLDAFAKWWPYYPRRVARASAIPAFAEALAKTDVDTLIAGAQRYARECAERGAEPRYIAHAKTWLRAERWGDPEEPRGSATAAGGRHNRKSAIVETLERIAEGDDRGDGPVLDLTPERNDR
jgi:hypothetical protein